MSRHVGDYYAREKELVCLTMAKKTTKTKTKKTGNTLQEKWVSNMKEKVRSGVPET